MIGIIIGMVFPAFAVSPDKDKGDKTKTDNLVPSPLPPSPWTLTIHSLDREDCPWGCTYYFYIQAASSPDCKGLFADPPFAPVQYYWGTTYYPVSIPHSIQCVYVSVGGVGGYCRPSSNTCCTCKSNPVCNLYVCH